MPTLVEIKEVFIPDVVEIRFPPPLPFVKRVAVKNVPAPTAGDPASALTPVLLEFPTKALNCR